MDDDGDFAIGIVMGAFLLAIACLVLAAYLAPKPRQLDHIYYCCEEDRDGIRCEPCRHANDRQISVGL